MGQTVTNPLIQEVRMQTNVLNSLIKSLGLPHSDEDTALKAEARRASAFKANAARWGRS